MQTQTETETPTETPNGTENHGKGNIEKSRKLKKEYRDFNYQMRSRNDELTDPNRHVLQDMLYDINDLGRKVERPSEQADDSEAFQLLTVKGREMSKRVAAGKGRTVNDFLRHLKVVYVSAENAQEEGQENSAAFNWDRLGRDTSAFFFQVPGASCLLGPLNQLPNPKKQIQRQVRKAVGAAVAPQELSAEDPNAKEKRETERNMETMHAVLNDHPEGVGYLELTMNHKSFAQFAENCFTLSFLVTNRKARFAYSQPNNEKGIIVYPHKEPTDKSKEDAPQEQDRDRAQLILAYDMQDWNTWKSYVRSEDCLMPHRTEFNDEAEAQATQAVADGGTQPSAATPASSSQPSVVGDSDEEEDLLPIGSRKRKSLPGTQRRSGAADQPKARHRLSKAS